MVEFPSEWELLFLVNWELFVSGREHLSGRVSQREGAIISLVNWELFVSGREHPSGGVSQ